MHRNIRPVLANLIVLWFVMGLGCASVEINSALVYLSQPNATDKAMEQLEIALAKDSTNAEAHLLLGVCFGQLKQFSKMNEEFDTATRLTAASPKDSQKCADKIQQYRDDFWLNIFNYGLELISTDMLSKAEIVFWACTLIDSTRPEAYFNLAIIEEEYENFEVALRHFETAFKNSEHDVNLVFEIASLYTQKNRYDKLLAIMDRLLKIAPENSEALAQKAIAHDNLGEVEQAMSSYEKAISCLPTDSDLLYNLGRLHFLNEQYERAEAVLVKVWELDSTDVQSTYLLGVTCFNLGELALEQISEKDSLSLGENVLTDTCFVDQAVSHFSDSIYYLKKSAYFEPGNTDVWNYLGLAYSYLGAAREADDAFARGKALEKK